MTAKIKLNAASGGGSVSIQAPSSMSNNRVFTIPDVADGTLLTSNTSTGKILQVVHTVFTATFSRATSNYDYGAIVTSNAITPSATDSKILIFAVMHMATNNSSGRFGYRVRRVVSGSSAHITPTQFGDGSDNRNVAAAAGRQDNSDQFTPMIFNGIDSPSTTSAVTYQIWSSGEQNDTIYVNRSRSNTDSATHYRPVSSIMLMELKA